MNIKYQKAILYFLTITILSSCSSFKVVSDIDETEDFTQFKTFEYLGWAEDSDQILNRFDKERIESSFLEEAQKRGMNKVESGGDVIAALYVLGEKRTEQIAQTTTMGGMRGMGGRRARGMRHPGWGWGAAHSTTIRENQYLEGTLAIELYDQADKKLIWQAVGKKRVAEDRQRRAAEIPKFISAIMEKYPVKPIKE